MASMCPPTLPSSSHKLNLAPDPRFSGLSSLALPRSPDSHLCCRCNNIGDGGNSYSASWWWDFDVQEMIRNAIKQVEGYFDSNRDRRVEDGVAVVEEGKEEEEWDWERWRKHFAEVDEQERMVSVLKSQLANAIKREDYEDAARLKVAVAAAATNDTVGRVISHLKDCIGAIDGTHIPATVSWCDANSYRNRHGIVSQNVLAACNFDLEFVYVLSGWEGSAHDSHVLTDALSRNNGLKVPQGKYFLVDGGYPNRRQFLAPFRGVRYHLQEFTGQGRHPEDAKELFNLRHASLRNVIERIFGIFKLRFKIFKTAPPFKYKIQTDLVLACVGLHNFLRKECRSDEFPIEVDNEAPSSSSEQVFEENFDQLLDTQEQQRANANAWRDTMANQMWIDVDHKCVEEERYGNASVLRDYAGAGLVGWWAGISDDSSDPYGRIIHIRAEYGRYIARSYSPRQLATALDGAPLFEVYLTNTTKSHYKQQAVYLKRKGPPQDLNVQSFNSSGNTKNLGHRDARDKREIFGRSSENSEDGDDRDDDSDFDNVLRDMIPGVKVKVVKLTAEKVDKDMISKVIEQIIDEEEEKDYDLENVDADDEIKRDNDDEQSDIELDAGPGVSEDEDRNQIAVEVVVGSGVIPKISRGTHIKTCSEYQQGWRKRVGGRLLLQ